MSEESKGELDIRKNQETIYDNASEDGQSNRQILETSPIIENDQSEEDVSEES